jgi:hypothetical protein
MGYSEVDDQAFQLPVSRRLGRYPLMGLLLVRRRQTPVKAHPHGANSYHRRPGAGKTTLLLALQARGYTIVGDTARTIVAAGAD